MRYVLSLSLLLMAGTALAHHGFTGRYDRSQPVWIDGTVTGASFGYPHGTLSLDPVGDAVPDGLPKTASEFADGLQPTPAGEPTEVEFPPVRLFNALESRIKVGDRVQLIALRNCEEPHQLRVQWIAAQSGDPVLRAGQMQEEVASC